MTTMRDKIEKHLAEYLVNRAVVHGGMDNLTVVMLEWFEKEHPTKHMTDSVVGELLAQLGQLDEAGI